MMKQEFEKLAGYEVSADDYYEIIEPMYTATKLTKQEFVKCIDKKRFALKTDKELIRDMKKEMRHLQEICGRSLDYESEDRLDKLTREYERRFGGQCYIIHGYEYPMMRGCSYPETICIENDNGTACQRITLQK